MMVTSIPASADTLTLDTCTESVLDSALDAAESGDTIRFTCSGTITITSTKVIDESITLDASDQTVVLDGGGRVRLFWVEAEAEVTFQHLTLLHGNAPYGGSAIHSLGTVTVIDSILSEHTHALSNFGEMTVRGSVFADNLGVGVYNSGEITIFASTFSGNRHGIDNASGTVTVINSTFTGNETRDPNGIGAGIANSGFVTVMNSTFVENFAPAGGGGIGTHLGGEVMLINTLLAHNGDSGNCFGPMIDGGGNLQFPDDSCGETVTVADPLLLPMETGEDVLPFFLLGEGSPAIGAGDADVCRDEAKVNNVDQRGVVRLGEGDDLCDIGAVESGS